MIGRQSLYAAPGELATLHSRYRASLTDDALIDGSLPFEGYTEPLFRSLGAAMIDSVDASNYESATRIHDLNQPIPESWKELYTVVLDGGSLEHVFNLPVALKNCMEMVASGGHYLAITPTNNFCGHGFYQFSPELYFNVFCKRNGFRVRGIYCVELGSAQWYQVSNPGDLRRRVTLVNSRPTYLLVAAQRINIGKIFEHTPQQTDYSAAWEAQRKQSEPVEPGSGLGLRNLLKRRFPQRTKEQIKAIANVFRGRFDSGSFRPVQDVDFGAHGDDDVDS
ncbi:MAG: hypothetical protein EOP84_24985 [Verrucomicrobiaceae bacterium]|nr:MAG: hypothetical protein EOP84_24985 [Verrucomicrobiaceae bacterium]